VIARAAKVNLAQRRNAEEPVQIIDPTLTIPLLVTRQAAAAPRARAIEAPDGEPLTYYGLSEHIRKTGADLRRLGIGSRDRVALSLPQGGRTATAILSVASNAVVAPLNPACRAREVDFFLRHVPARALIVERGHPTEAAQVAHDLGIPVLELIPETSGAGMFTLRGAGTARPVDDPRVPAPDDVALVLYTSGTTAEPKLVPLTHRNLLAATQYIARSLALTSDDRALHVVPMFHVQGLVTGILAPLFTRGTLVCPGAFQADAVLDWLARFRPTWYTAVPAMHQQVLDRLRAMGSRRLQSSLRFVRSSATPLPPDLAAAVEETFGVPVINAYGMTEAAPIIATTPMPPAEPRHQSVGRTAGPAIAILDEAGNELEPGEPGEIAVRGPNIMSGYERAPEANAAAFTNGWFRTGDIGHLDAEGYLYITGRLKDIINRGGEKITPYEIEDTLREHPAVADAVVFPVPDGRMGQAVGAAVVLRAGGTATERELREYTSERLTYFKIPARVLMLDELPKGPTGKLQRARLAERLGLSDAHPTVERTGAEAPRTALQAELADIWCAMLGVSSVGPTESFFVAGGDSFLFAEMLYRARERYGVDLPVQALITTPTIAAVASRIEGAEREGAPSRTATPAPRVSGAPRRMTPTERRLVEIWSEVLGVAPRSTSDNFFHLGGESVPVAKLFELIRREFGVDVPVRALMESPTLDALARVIDVASPRSGLLMTLQPNGAKAPIFAIHDGGGYYFYWALAARVAQDRPFYAVQAETHLNGWGRPYGGARTVEELAQRYIQEIDRMQPEGPYHLAGTSFGGVIAFEMARQLATRQTPVASLTLVSTLLREPKHGHTSAARTGFVRRMRRHAREVLNEIEWRWRSFRKPAIVPTVIHQRYLRVGCELAARYRPRPYDGHAVLFHATTDPAPAWAHLFSGGLRVHEMPGRHMEMVHPSAVESVATLMRSYIGAAEAALRAAPVSSEAAGVAAQEGVADWRLGPRVPMAARYAERPALGHVRAVGSA
jgi:acyl-CoA synthetase (AMP-forming)/AMP-acid ligase II/thioesterase domain-containing protein/acyl carrier protein